MVISKRVNAQQNVQELDSLKKIYTTSTDLTTKENLLLRFIDLDSDFDSIITYCKKGLSIAKQNKSKNIVRFENFLFYSELAIFSEEDVTKALELVSNDKDKNALIYLKICRYYFYNFNDFKNLSIYMDKLFNHLPKHPKLLSHAYFYKSFDVKLSGKPYEKINYLNKAIEIAKEGKTISIIPNSYKAIYYNYLELRQYDLAIEALQNGLAYTDPTKYSYVDLLLLIGNIYKSEKKYDLALEKYKSAYMAFIKEDYPYAYTANLYKYIAEAYFLQKQNDSGLYYLQKIKPNLVTVNRFKKFTQSDVYFLKGLYNYNIKRLDSTDYYFTSIFPLLTEEGDMVEKQQYLAKYGTILTESNQPKKAVNVLTQALEFALKAENTDDLDALYQQLYLNYKKLNNTSNALQYLEKYNSIKDSIYEGSIAAKTEEFLVKTESKEKENKILALTADNQQKELQVARTRTYLIAGAALVIVGIVLFYFLVYDKRKKKHKQRLLLLDKERELLEGRNKLLENISHEIRTPVSVINGYLHLIQQNSTNAKEVKRFADLATTNTNNIISNFNTFLEITNRNENALQFDSYKHNLSAFFSTILSNFVGYAQLKNLGLFYKQNFTSELELTFDFDKLEKIVNNLISNAIKYTNAKKNIYVNVKVEERLLIITIKDEGFGIPKDEHDLIFNRFYQSKNHKVSGGFGIGLSFVKELVDFLKGTITLESEVGIGTIFTLKLPIQLDNISVYKNATKAKYNAIAPIQEEIPIDNSNLPNVLVVEDNLEMTIYLKEILKDYYNCVFVNNGKEALVKAKQQLFDLVISDFRMPVMDGLEFKTQLNTIEGYQKTPFLLLTAYTFNDIEKVKIRFGIEDYVAKPFTYKEIITRTRKLLENTIYIKKITDMDSETTIDGHVNELITKVKELITKNMANSDYSIADLASDSGYSQKQLGRIIKTNTGLTVVKLILEIRLQKAYELIIKNKYATLMEVIYAIGLNNRSYFNKKFEERFGIKPGELQDKQN